MRALRRRASVRVARSAARGTRSSGSTMREEIYLSLDGTATVYVNSSLAALNALRGTSFDASPAARVDRARDPHVLFERRPPASRASASRAAAAAASSTCGSTSTTCAGWRGRRRSRGRPTAFERDGDLFIYRQTVGAAPRRRTSGTSAGTAARSSRSACTCPARSATRTPSREVGRGNILEWEQPLADRLRGVPLELEARMDTQSILYRTLWLFGATFVAVAVALRRHDLVGHAAARNRIG